MQGTPENGTAWRLGELERRVRDLEKINPAVLAEQIRGLRERISLLEKHFDERMDDLEADQASVRKALIAAGLSVAGSAALFCLTAFQVFG